MRRFILVVPVVAAALGVAAHGVWGAVGIVAALAAGLLAHQLGARGATVAFAASVPPLVASGPTIIPVALVLLLVALWRRVGDARVLLAGALGVLLPFPSNVVVPVVAGAIVLAAAPFPLALAGLVLLALPASVDMAASLVAGGVAVLGALGARAMARHPANLTQARGLVKVGLAISVVPAGVGLALAVAGRVPPSGAPLALALLGALALGGALLLAFVGLAALHLAEDARSEAWVAMTAAAAGSAGAALLASGGLQATTLLLPSLAFLAVPAAIGIGWLQVKREDRSHSD